MANATWNRFKLLFFKLPYEKRMALFEKHNIIPTGIGNTYLNEASQNKMFHKLYQNVSNEELIIEMENNMKTWSKYFCGGLKGLCTNIGSWRLKKGFDTGKHNIPEKLLLIHSEVSEACEEHRKGNWSEFEYELADIAIRLFDLVDGCNIDLASKIAEKMEKNEGREYKHGKVY